MWELPFLGELFFLGAPGSRPSRVPHPIDRPSVDRVGSVPLKFSFPNQFSVLHFVS